VYEICHRVLVLFRGEIVANLRPSEVDIDDIVGWITGSAVAARRLHG
jgi:ABC-type sugar transport system ATPase subunit